MLLEKPNSIDSKYTGGFMLETKTETLRTKPNVDNLKVNEPKLKLKVSTEQMEKLKASELLASRVTCQRR